LIKPRINYLYMSKINIMNTDYLSTRAGKVSGGIDVHDSINIDGGCTIVFARNNAFEVESPVVVVVNLCSI
jgi:hypothetical protein